MTDTNASNPNQTSAPSREELYAALDSVSLAEARSFRRRLRKARAPHARAAIAADIAKAQQRVQKVADAVPEISYPDTLPVSGRRDDIAEAIDNNQVVIIAGETGSGKTCLLYTSPSPRDGLLSRMPSSA